MSVGERDPLTGHRTTGHEWDGITELNTRVPRAIWVAIVVTHVWALVYWVLMPAWPLVWTYTGGILGIDQREVLAADLMAAQAARSDWKAPLANLSADEIRADPALMAHVRRTAPALYEDNCAGCHGTEGRGGPGYPSLVDDAWLWGGDAGTIMETLRVGINADHSDSRYAQMLAFGRDGILDAGQIRVVADYVQSLSGRASDVPAERLEAGATIFADHCASCHGEEGGGIEDLGAPDLADGAWIYGDDDEALFETIWAGRQGWMPAWEGRLTRAERVILTLHVQDLAGEDTR